MRRPRDLEGHTVGVTGLPSDEAVVDSEVSADGGDPAEVDRVTIGFNAVSSLAAGKVDAATGFWNAEGVALRRAGRPDPRLQGRRIRRPALPRAGPRPPRGKTLDDDPELVDAVVDATDRGYGFAVAAPGAGPRRPARRRPEPRPRRTGRPSCGSCCPTSSPRPFDPAVLRAWAAWDLEHGLLERPLDVDASAFASSAAAP